MHPKDKRLRVYEWNSCGENTVWRLSHFEATVV